MEKFKVNSKVLAVISITAVIFGSWLIFSSPGRRAEKSLIVAKQLVASEVKELKQFNSNFQVTLNWYKQEYTLPITVLLSSCQEKSVQAESEIKAAENAGSSKEKRAHADKAKDLIKTVSDDLVQAQNQLVAFEKMTADARQELAQVKVLIPDAISYQALAEKRLTNEGPDYLSKYTAFNEKILIQAKNDLAEIVMECQDASNLLPVESNLERLGDPSTAMELLKTAKENLTAVESAVDEVMKNFNFYRAATDKAGVTIDSSQQKIAIASDYLNGLVAKGPFKPAKSLKTAFKSIVQAEKILAEASVVLGRLTAENKYDFPLAYGDALKALDLADKAIQEANCQVALFTEATKGLGGLRLIIADLEKRISNSKSYQNKLHNHAQNTWSAVANNASMANQNYYQAKDYLAKAEYLISIDQAYETAIIEMQSGLQFLDQGQSLILALVQLAESLESYRLNWPDIERQAENAVSDEESNITDYGDYSPSAKSDFDSANDCLSSARFLANNQEYQLATQKAEEAINLADGTGNRALRAYRTHQERQNSANDFSNTFDSGSLNSSNDSGWNNNNSFSDSSNSISSSDSYGYGGSSSSSSDGDGYGSSSSGSDGYGY